MFGKIKQFEDALAEFTGAPYAIMTDCCTHALELCFRYERVKSCVLTPFTYISVPMMLHRLGIFYSYLQFSEQWVGEYEFYGTRIWDSARLLQANMYRPGRMQCVSFGHDKPLQIGGGGAILLDDEQAYQTMIRQRYDGRDLNISPWQDQKTFHVGYHYRPTPEQAIKGIGLLIGIKENNPAPVFKQYPDLRSITIVN